MSYFNNPFKHMRNRFHVFTFLDNIINSISNPGGIIFTSLFIYMNLDESQVAVLLSLSGLCALLQIFSTLLYQKTSHKKRLILSFYLFRTLSLFLIGLIPFIFEVNQYFIMVFLLMLLRFSFLNILGGGLMEWMDSHVPEGIKGRYYGRRNALLNAGFIVTSFVTGKILDHFDPSPYLYLGFFGAALAIYVFELLILLKIPIIKKEAKQPLTLSEIFKLPLRDKSYRKFIIFSLLWVFALSLGKPLLNIYVIKYMDYTYTLLAVIMSVTAFLKIFSGVFFGHLIDDRGVAFVIILCGIGYALFGFMFIFLTPSNPIIFIIASIGVGVFMIGFNVSKFRLNVHLSRGEYMNTYLSANSFFVGIGTFLSLYFSSIVIDFFKTIEITIANHSINSYQLLFLGSSTLHLIAVYYFIKTLKEMPTTDEQI